MTDTINNGGPAFPCEEEASTSFSGCPVMIQHSGMSLRDYFATAALQGIAVRTYKDASPAYYTGWAELAYKHADAMLAERNKNND